MSTLARVVTSKIEEPKAKNLAVVKVHIDADRHLSARRKRDLHSSLKAVAKALGRDLDRVPADWRQLGKRLSAIHPEQVSFRKKRWQNAVSDLKFAIKHVNGRLGQVPKSRAPLGPAWSRMRDRLCDHPAIHRGISRFMSYCDAEGIAPDAVDDRVSERYLAYLEDVSLSKSPKSLHRATCSMWNRAGAEVFGWPRRRLTVPNYRQPSWTMPWDRFSPSFTADAEAYLAWLAGDDLVTRDPPDHVCKPSTLVITEREIRRLASAAVLQGVPAGNIRSLADLISKEIVTATATHYWEDEGSGRTYQKDLLKRLNKIARHWVKADESHLQWLQRLNRRWQKPQTGLTEKNRMALRQFQNPNNTNLMLTLPHRLIQRARSGRLHPRRAATLFQKALAIEILIMAPMRIGNLSRLRLDQHIVLPAGGRGLVHLVVPESEVKNTIPLEFELPAGSAALLKEYLLDYRQQLVGEDDPWLFPGVDGQHKVPQTLSEQLKKVINKETGLTLTAHQFRHLAAKWYLDRQPGDYETVRRLLGHKSRRTTVDFYTGLETLAATRQYDQEILRLRDQPHDGGPDA